MNIDKENVLQILITGIAGFAGCRLAEYLLTTAALPNRAINADSALTVHGIIHRHDWRIQHLSHHLGTRLHLHRGDLRNAVWVNEFIETLRPDLILHLAAWSDVGGSWKQPWTAYELNIQCQLNLLEALCRWTPESRTLVVTSNEIYGLIQLENLPIDEDTPFRPNSPYGVSKVTQDVMGLQYWLGRRLPVIRARSFNHIGPGQSDAFAASAFARQIAEIELGQREPVVRVGNLEAQRDFTDVRDVVRAYWHMVTEGEPGMAYNVGSGSSRPVRWLLDTLLSLTDAPVTVEIDPTRLRPSDVPISVCDNRRLSSVTGWQPEIDLRTSLADLLESWRVQLRIQEER